MAEQAVLDQAELRAVELGAARARLAARHGQVLGELLAGRVPAGFDPRTAAAAGAQLRGRRRHDAVRARPRLAGVPGLPGLFDDYARGAPRTGCAHADADAFGAWLLTVPLPRPTADWVALRRVESGEQRWALLRPGGRRVLVLGLGARVWRVAAHRDDRRDDRDDRQDRGGAR